MNTNDDLYEEVVEQEKTLQFSEFTSKTALKIGMSLIQRAENEHKAVTIDITRNGHQLFHYAFDGTSPDNDNWILRKAHVVNRFNMSSLRYRLKLEKSGKTIADLTHICATDYAVSDGSFPIIIRNVGVVGSITISGDIEDHALVVWGIKKYLSE